MTFTTTLFKAIDSADKVAIDGVEMEGGYNGTEGTRFLTLADHTQVSVKDQPIELDGMGTGTGLAKAESDGGEFEYDFKFEMVKPMTEADLT